MQADGEALLGHFDMLDTGAADDECNPPRRHYFMVTQ
jgi:hypothetical protein